jgi:hypothetical protein
MNRRNCKGFLLTYVIVAMALMGVVMIVLSGGAGTMLTRANEAYLRGVERNLTASGLAWARTRISSGSYPAIGESAELDPGPFGAPKTALVVSVLEVREKDAKVRISTTCTRGRRTLNTTRDYLVELL